MPDYVYDRWAQELYQLQQDYPKIASKVDYHEYFKDYDGSTGMDLPYMFPEIEAIAQSLLDTPKNRSRKKVVDKKVQVRYDNHVLKKKSNKIKIRKR